LFYKYEEVRAVLLTLGGNKNVSMHNKRGAGTWPSGEWCGGLNKK